MAGKKIAYIGIDLLYPALPALLEAGCELLEVITCETDNVTEFNTRVCDFAKKEGIPLFIGRITAERLRGLCGRGCEAVVCGGYYYRVPIVEGLKMVNIHPSLLPVGRGAWPMPVTILRGLRESGVTVHQMTEGFDEGPILLQEAIPVSANENLRTLTEKQMAVLPGMMRRLAADFDTLYEQAKPQGDGEYWPCPSEEDYPLAPDTPLEETDRILRAFYGYECIYLADGIRYGLIGGVARGCEMSPAVCEPPEKTKGFFPVCRGMIQAEHWRRIMEMPMKVRFAKGQGKEMPPRCARRQVALPMKVRFAKGRAPGASTVE